MKRIGIKQVGKVAVLMGRVARNVRCPTWAAQLRRAGAVVAGQPRLRKLI